MEDNLQTLSEAGVSIWLDDLSRDRLANGSLAELISGSHVVGVTTNPSIFSAAIKNSELYKDDVLALKSQGKSVSDIVTALTTSDVSAACDLFLPTYEKSLHVDGRVSIEVDPFLAHESAASVLQGKSLWEGINRDNLLIKIPATLEGLSAIRELTASGISVNVTLIFSVDRYRKVMDAYLSGLEDRLAAHLPINEIFSVASFFVSRIDSEIDRRLDAVSTNSPLRGKSAIFNAVLAYEAYLLVIASPRWQELLKHGGRKQRPLWASTGVKDKSYDSTRYVVELIANDCVNTMPEATLNDVRLHGLVQGDSITPAIPTAHEHFDLLKSAGVDFDNVVELLEREGVKKFADAWQELHDNIRMVS